MRIITIFQVCPRCRWPFVIHDFSMGLHNSGVPTEVVVVRPVTKPSVRKPLGVGYWQSSYHNAASRLPFILCGERLPSETLPRPGYCHCLYTAAYLVDRSSIRKLGMLEVACREFKKLAGASGVYSVLPPLRPLAHVQCTTGTFETKMFVRTDSDVNWLEYISVLWHSPCFPMWSLSCGSTVSPIIKSKCGWLNECMKFTVALPC